jgi:hypothetical protein
MKVTEAREGMTMCANCVFVIPPNKSMALVHVRDLTNQKMFRYKLGDALADGRSRWWTIGPCSCRATRA